MLAAILNGIVLHIVFTALLTAVCDSRAPPQRISPICINGSQTPRVYKTTLDNLFKALASGDPDAVPWLQEYLRTKNGVDNPGQIAITVETKMDPQALRAGFFGRQDRCQPEMREMLGNTGNFLYVLFVPGGRAATALLTVDGTDNQFFGAPDDDQKNALKAAAVKQ